MNRLLTRRFLGAGAAWTAALMLALPMQTQAQASFPNRPLRIVVPVVPGAFTDTAARAIAVQFSGQLGQQVLVENRPGAGTTLGADAVAKSTPDGHTLLFTENGFTVLPALYPQLPFDPLRDFVHVTLVAQAPYLLWARPDLPQKSLREFVDAARVNPGKFTFGSGGQGTSSHLVAELFFDKAKISVLHVPFKGVGASMGEVMASRVDIGGSSIASPIGHIRSGRLRAVAVTGSERSPMLPDVPTFAEAGFTDFDAPIWFGFMVPAGTPSSVVTRIHEEVGKAVAKPVIVELFAKQGAKAFTIPSAQFTERIAAEMQTWKEFISRRGIKIQ